MSAAENLPIFQRGDHAELADFALEDLRGAYREIVSYGGSLYGYRNGIFERIPDNEIGRIVKRYAGAPFREGRRRLAVNAGTIGGTSKVVHIVTEDARFFDDAPPGIVFADRFVRVTPEGLQGETLSPQHRARHRYAFPLGQAESPQRFIGFLESVFRDDADKAEKIAALQEFMGAAIAGVATTHERALLLFGPGANGKTRLVEIIRATMPADSVVTLPPALMGDQYARSILINARLNTEADIPHDAISPALKGIVSGEQVQARDPGSKGVYFSPRCAHVFGCNMLPHTEDTTDGFWRRWLIVPMTRDFRTDPERDPNILAKIIPAELSGIVHWALAGAVRLMGQRDYTLPTSHHLALARWRGKEDSVRLFIETRTREATAEEPGTAAIELHAAYKKWAETYGSEPVSLQAFGRELKDRGYPGVRASGGQRYGRILMD